MSLSRAGLLVASLLALSSAVGCSSDKDLTQPDAGPTPYCPTTVEKAAGAACTGDVRCDYHYACETFAQQAVCHCVGGKFTCTDGTNAEVPAGGQPVCAPVKPPAATCPANLAAAQGQSCTPLGSSCYYPGVTCADGLMRTNTCTCKPGTTDAGSVWVCEVPICPVQ
jgi:hypothetical protein